MDTHATEQERWRQLYNIGRQCWPVNLGLRHSSLGVSSTVFSTENCVLVNFSLIYWSQVDVYDPTIKRVRFHHRRASVSINQSINLFCHISIKSTRDLVDEEVADFLQEDDDATRSAVEPRMTPRQADDVHQRRQVLRDVLELDQFDLIEQLLDRLQVQADVLRLIQRYTHRCTTIVWMRLFVTICCASKNKETILLPITSPNSDQFLPCDAMLARYMPSSCVCLSVCVCVCVCHTPVLYQKG